MADELQKIGYDADRNTCEANNVEREPVYNYGAYELIVQYSGTEYHFPSEERLLTGGATPGESINSGAEIVGVNTSSWSVLSPTSPDVQATFDDIDANLVAIGSYTGVILKDGSVDMEGAWNCQAAVTFDAGISVDNGTTDIVARFASSDDLASIIVSDDDTDVYVTAKDSTMSLGLNAGLSSSNVNIDSAGMVALGATSSTIGMLDSVAPTAGTVAAGIFQAGTIPTLSSTLYNEYSVVAVNNKAGSALNNYGGRIGFSAPATLQPRAAIAAKQTDGGSGSYIGLSFQVHTSSVGANNMVEAMVLNHLGYLGINATPSYQLDVNSGTTDIVARFASSDDLASIIISDDDTTVYVTAKDSTMSLGLNGGLSTSNVNIDASGNLALGATTASYKLDVTGTVRVTGAAIFETSVNITDDIPINLGASGDAVIRYNSTTTALEVLASNTNDLGLEALGGDCYIQKTVGGDVLVFSGAVEGETPVVDIYGFRTGDLLRTLSIGISSAYDDTASFSGLSTYIFDGSIHILTGAALAKISYDGSNIYVDNESGPTIVREGVTASEIDLLTIGDITTNFGSKGLKIGDSQAAVDQTILFDGETADATIAAMAANGEIRISANDATNYLAVEPDGTIELNGTATGFEDINIDLSPLQTGGTAPGFDTIGTTGIRLRAFSVAEDVDGTFEIPHRYKLGSNITPHIHFAALSAPSGTDYVRWQLDYFIVDSAGTVTTATSINTGDVAVDTLDKRVDANFPTFSHAALGGQVGFKISRISQAGDTFTGEVGVFTFGFHYEVDTPAGSRTITTK